MKAQRAFWLVSAACLILMAIAVYFVVRFVLAGYQTNAQVMTQEAVAARLKPIGEVVINQSGPAGSRSGEAVYKALCFSCHASGLAGSPKLGDHASWQSRLNKGFDTLVKHAVTGFNAMPAKGGDPGLTDEEVARAVAFMGNSVGAKFIEPKMAESDAAKTTVNPALVGKKVYESICVACHGTGVAGAPKFGDKAAWAPRLAKGFEAMLASANQGLNAMPAKGGFTGTDEEFNAAVIYISNYKSK
jgi:cytochrome c5